MIKYTKFQDIPEFTRGGNYQVTVSWRYLEEHLEHWDQRDAKSPLILDPDFQRCRVWDDEKRIKYVEFILRNGQSARDVYFNCSSWQTNYNTPIELVDGKQRIDAVRMFLRGEIPAFNSYFGEYTDKVDLIRSSFTFHVNNLKTRREVLTWYIEMNSGGVAHTTEEIEKVKKLLAKELK